MKLILATALMMIAATAQAEIDANPSREREVLKAVVSQANDLKTDLGKYVQKMREDGVNGFQQEEGMVIPKPLKARHIKIVDIGVDDYRGTIRGPDEIEEGYENRVYLAFIPVKSVSYGGRIEGIESIIVKCTSDKSNEDGAKSNIECHVADVKVQE